MHNREHVVVVDIRTQTISRQQFATVVAAPFLCLEKRFYVSFGERVFGAVLNKISLGCLDSTIIFQESLGKTPILIGRRYYGDARSAIGQGFFCPIKNPSYDVFFAPLDVTTFVVKRVENRCRAKRTLAHYNEVVK